MKYIKKILAYLKPQTTPVAEPTAVSCNYSDNYYGDRCCASTQSVTQTLAAASK